MKKLDFKLSRPKEHYISLMDESEHQYEFKSRTSFFGKNYLEGVHFKKSPDKIFGYYCEHGFMRMDYRLRIPFQGRFVTEGDGQLYFRGYIYLPILDTALYLFFLLIFILTSQPLPSIIFVFFFICWHIYRCVLRGITLYGELEKFFS